MSACACGRFGVAGLRQGRDRTDLDKTETHGLPGVYAACVFVQTCGQTDAVGEAQSAQANRVVHACLAVQLTQDGVLSRCQHSHGLVMHGFSVHSEKQRSKQ